MMLIILVTTQSRTMHRSRVPHVSNGASDRPPSGARLALSARDVSVAACERLRMVLRDVDMPAAALDGAGGGSDDHRMQIVTETSHVTEGRDPLRGRRRRRSSQRLRTRPRVPRRLHARAPVHQHGCTAGSHGHVEWPE
eukprot:7080459-Prymnesium_polylepis.1